LAIEDIQKELDRRRPGQSITSTQRKEEDRAEILSGIFEGKTTGTPIFMMVWNKDANSSAYDALQNSPRPGHADYAYQMKYGLRDHRGGGRASARETVGRVAAGAIAKKILAFHGIEIIGYVVELGGIKANIISSDISRLKATAESNPVRCPDLDAAKRMLERLDEVRKEGDSLGGIVAINAKGVPAGLGEPVFDKLDADLAKALMSLGSVKSVEIGLGIESAKMRGSEMNDPIIIRDDKIDFESNNAGGILGGISTGALIVCRIAVKPTPSISRKQRTVDLVKRNAIEIEIHGRHDPAIPPRIVPVAEAMVALVLTDHLLRQRATKL
jgi:chorismate synthase